jgi:hypothetical protein
LLPPLPPPVLPAHVPFVLQMPKQHSLGSDSPGAEHAAPGNPHVLPPSGCGWDAHAVPPLPSGTQLTEQQESCCVHAEPSARHDEPTDPAKHWLLMQSPLQQCESSVQNAAVPTQAGAVFGLAWQYAPSPSSWQNPVQHSASFKHDAPTCVSVHG